MSAPFWTDGRVLIIGGGLAGLMTALKLAPEPSIVLTKAPFGVEASSAWAQGGIAAAVGVDDDPDRHLADTLAAGDGLCDPEVAARILRAGPAAIDDLIRLGARFDRRPDGALCLGREAAHGRHRIIHATGDGTGREVLRAALAAARATPSITLMAGVEGRRLLLADGRVAGLLAVGPDGPLMLPTRRVVIATGGVAGLYRHGTSPLGAWGSGLALAARAGAALRDMEFVQFHPTALDCDSDPLPLVSEAVRGDGAILVDEAGTRFMADVPDAELATRDVVSRAVWRHAAAGHRVFLDARPTIGDRFAARFPTVAALCAAAGIDPARDPIPVRPAAHYGMGGIAVDAAGRSTLPGLWACGEAASTGLHGANRLASNSLLEAAVCAGWVANDLRGTPAGPPLRSEVVTLPSQPDLALVRGAVSAGAGVLRHREGLARVIATLLPLAEGDEPSADPAAVGLAIAVAAMERRESRGAHHRIDAPDADPGAARSRSVVLADVVAAARAQVFEEA